MPHLPRRARRASFLMLLALCLAGIYWVDPGAWRGSPGGPAAEGGPRSVTGQDPPPGAEAAALAGWAHSGAGAGRATVTSGELLSDAALTEILEEMAARPWEDLEDLLRPLAIRPANMERVLALLSAGGLRMGPERGGEVPARTRVAGVRAAEVGAVRAIGLACMLYTAAPGTGELGERGIRVDGRAFLTSVLVSLAHIPAPCDEVLVRLLMSLRQEGRGLFDPSLLELVRTLAEEHPGKRLLYETLLAGLGEELTDADHRAFYSRFLTETDSPALLKDALIELLGDAGQERAVLAWAGEVFDGEGASAELREEIAMAVALAAPPKDAAAFLGQRATAGMLAQVHSLGARAGGMQALVDEYNQLAMLDAHPGARKMLISGLSTLGATALLDVARTDMDAAVRGQALVTMTWSAETAPPETIDILRLGLREQDDPEVGIPASQVLSAAHNLATRARGTAGPQLGESVDLMRRIALAQGTGPLDRQRAVHALRTFLGEAEWNSLRDQARALLKAGP